MQPQEWARETKKNTKAKERFQNSNGEQIAYVILMTFVTWIIINSGCFCLVSLPCVIQSLGILLEYKQKEK